MSFKEDIENMLTKSRIILSGDFNHPNVKNFVLFPKKKYQKYMKNKPYNERPKTTLVEYEKNKAFDNILDSYHEPLKLSIIKKPTPSDHYPLVGILKSIIQCGGSIIPIIYN